MLTLLAAFMVASCSVGTRSTARFKVVRRTIFQRITARRRTTIPAVMRAIKCGASLDKRRQFDEAFKAGVLRLALESRSAPALKASSLPIDAGTVLLPVWRLLASPSNEGAYLGVTSSRPVPGGGKGHTTRPRSTPRTVPRRPNVKKQSPLCELLPQHREH